MELKRHVEAAEQMRQCLAKRQETVASPINPEILKAGPNHCLALCLVASGEKDAAERAFVAALADDPTSRRAGIDFARVLAAHGKTIDSLKELNRLVAEDPNEVGLWHLGGQIALSRPDYLEFARDWTGEAVKHFPAHTGLLMQRGEALLLTQKPEAALPFWLKAHSPNSPRQVAALVLCEFLTGDFHRQFAPAEEAAVSQELVKWYRQLIAVGAHFSVRQLHDRMEQIRQATPGFVRVWEAATQQAREATVA
jgi:predicted Zn-dependent protease